MTIRAFAATDRPTEAKALIKSARLWGWELHVASAPPECLTVSWRNTNKLCLFAHALRSARDGGQNELALLLDAHDTLLQATPQEAINAARPNKIIIEDEAQTKVSAHAYAAGLRCV